MRNAGPLVILFVLVGLAALALFALSRNSDYDHSALGNKGLEVWLQAKDIPVLRSDPHIERSGSEVSLRIVPLPLSSAKPADGKEQDKTSDDDSPAGSLEDWVYEADDYELPTLVTMPKWLGSVLEDGIAKPSAMVALSDISTELAKISLGELRLARNVKGFEDGDVRLADGQSVRIALYQAQTFQRDSLPETCREIAGIKSGALVVQCDDWPDIYLLSDPDLLNNHGMALADNAAFAVALIEQLRGAGATQPVYLDSSGKPLDGEVTEDEGRTYERSATDLARYFAYPLSVIWGMIFLVAAICFWRGAWRFGPAAREAAATIEISKTAAIEATARLLRLSGNDGRMVAQFVQSLLADKAQALFGAGAANQAGIERMFQRLARRDRAGAEALQSAASALIDRGHSMSRSDLHRNLETFRKLLGSTELGSQ